MGNDRAGAGPPRRAERPTAGRGLDDEDVIGRFRVQGGLPEPGSYQRNVAHRLLTTKGLFQLEYEWRSVSRLTSNEFTHVFLGHTLGCLLEEQCRQLHRFNIEAFVLADLRREHFQTLEATGSRARPCPSPDIGFALAPVLTRSSRGTLGACERFLPSPGRIPTVVKRT